MKICILMENTTTSPELQAEHGLSIYMETSGHKLLVDTGQSSHTWDNAAKMGIDLKSIDAVIISHGHYDHAGGLLGFSDINPNANIYMQRTAAGAFYHGERYIGIDPEILDLPGHAYDKRIAARKITVHFMANLPRSQASPKTIAFQSQYNMISYRHR